MGYSGCCLFCVLYITLRYQLVAAPWPAAQSASVHDQAPILSEILSDWEGAVASIINTKLWAPASTVVIPPPGCGLLALLMILLSAATSFYESNNTREP